MRSLTAEQGISQSWGSCSIVEVTPSHVAFTGGSESVVRCSELEHLAGV
jgi:hypothetical protein